MTRDLYLTLDVGTCGLRAALVTVDGRLLAYEHAEHEQIVPRHGGSEQRPADWWAGTRATIAEVLTKVPDAPARVAAICGFWQMHATVLVDADDRLTRDTAPLWNDRRNQAQVDGFVGQGASAMTANLHFPAWPAFNLRWIAEHDPGALAARRPF